MNKSIITINADEVIGTINPNLYGHFIEHLGHCVDGGIWVGPESSIPNINGIRRDVVEALKRIKPPVVRWPGGCFADDYHWQDGIGPRAQRPKRVNIHWGEVIENNHFGTHEFIEFCRLIGAEPYICGNVGSGAVRELRDWVEYLNFDGDSTWANLRARNGHPEPFGVKYFGIGNENWGCGGNMAPEYYAHEVRRYTSFLKDFGKTPLYRIACGPSGDDPSWTRKFFGTLSGCLGGCSSMLRGIQGFAAHYYCGTSGTATEYTEDQWYELLHRSLQMEPLIVRHRAIMDGFDPQRKIGLIVDEWGTWHPVMLGTHPKFLRQQNTVRDALVAALTLNIFNRHADKVVMANIAQMINVLQAMILTDGPNMILTPTYHVFDMFAVHQGASALACIVNTDAIVFRTGGSQQRLPRLTASASLRERTLHLSIVNTHASETATVQVNIRGMTNAGMAFWQMVGGQEIHAYNTFADPARVTSQTLPLSNGDEITLPPASVSVIGYVVE